MNLTKNPKLPPAMIDPLKISCWMDKDGRWWSTGYDRNNEVGVYEMPFKAVESRWKVVTGQVKP